MRKRQHIPDTGPHIMDMHYGRLIGDYGYEVFERIDKWVKNNPDLKPADLLGEDLNFTTFEIIEWAINAPVTGDWSIPHHWHTLKCDYFFAVATIARDWFRNLSPIRKWIYTYGYKRNLEKMTDGDIARAVKHHYKISVTKDAVRVCRTEICKRQAECKRRWRALHSAFEKVD